MSHKVNHKGLINMSCYFRRLKGIFDEAGIEVTASNKKQLDQAIHQMVGTDYKDCPGTWKKLKQQIMADFSTIQSPPR